VWPMPVVEHLPLLELISQPGAIEVDRGPELDQIRPLRTLDLAVQVRRRPRLEAGPDDAASLISTSLRALLRILLHFTCGRTVPHHRQTVPQSSAALRLW
jgi:hypothetical protein